MFLRLIRAVRYAFLQVEQIKLEKSIKMIWQQDSEIRYFSLPVCHALIEKLPD